ncbi:hypothetical protein [Polynucleobacter sp. Adler-ghost]|uniref:hypothetical protein n=1 Tax=Polynucleobacter sp. Adler-ghost TaxID=2770234 RepID=UPI001BFED486|nr:hypothetical protein [Polynucleobacter sp. Adler-ghost]QWE30524.1 hypothetical protein ICV89_09615 [Polynucleobacter sp. Adler-ghost]
MTILTFKKDLSSGRTDGLSIFESYTRKKTWWNLGLSTRINFGVHEIYSINSHHREKFPLLISHLESRSYNLLVYRKTQSLLRHILRKEPRIRGDFDLQSGYISIDMYEDSFTNFQNSYHNFGKMEIGLQFDDELLEKIEKSFRDGNYPIIDSYENYNRDSLLKVNFSTIRFNK